MPEWLGQTRSLPLVFYVSGVCLTGLLLSCLAAWYVARANDEIVQARFESATGDLADRVTARVGSYEHGLRGLRGAALAVGGAAFDRRTFDRYSDSRNAEREFPGARGFGFIRRVPMAQEAAFVLAARSEGAPDFKIRQQTAHLGDRDVIQYIAPLERNREAVGLDVASEPASRSAAIMSARTGAATLTAPMTLTQATGHSSQGFLLVLPIYRPDSPQDTPEARERATIGWAYAPLLIDEVLRPFASDALALSLDDATISAQPLRVFVSPEQAIDTDARHQARISRSLFGRTWVFDAKARQAFLVNRDIVSPLHVLLVGATGAVLLGALLYTYLLSRPRVPAADWASSHDVAQRHLETILNALPPMIAYWDKHLINRFANQSYANWFDLSPGELAGKHIREMPGGNQLYDRNREHIEAVLRGEPQTFQQTMSLPRQQDVRHWLAHFLPDVVAGEIRGFYILVHDVSELTESKLLLAAALREKNALLNTLDSLALVSMTDRAGKITYVNDAFCKISGYARDELVGQDHRIINSRTHPSEFWRSVWLTIGHATPWRGTICNRAKDGSLYWVDSMIAPSLDEHGKIERYISIRTDVTQFKRAEFELRGASEMLRAKTLQLKIAQSITHVGSWELDVATGAVVWSEELYRIMGLEPGKPAPDFQTQASLFTKESWARLTPAVQRAIETGEAYELTLEIVLANGSLRIGSARGEVVRDAAGNTQRLVGTLQDITERERAANATRELSTRLQLARSAAQMGVWDWNLHDNTIVWDETLFQLYGISARPMDYDVWIERLHPDDRQATQAALERARAGTGEYNLTFRIVHDNGQTRYLRAAAVVQRDAAGQAVRIVGVNWDITEQRVTENALRSSEVLQRTILTHAGSAIIATDRDGVITLWNRAAEALLSYAANEVVGLETPGLFHDPQEVEAHRAVLEAEGVAVETMFDVFVAKARAGATDTNEWTYVRKDGLRVPVLLTVTCLREDSGAILGYLGVAVDLTATKRQESQLKELNRLLALRGEQSEAASEAKSRFLANMSHEIRTPLNAVIGLTYLLEQSELKADQRALVGKVQLAGRALLGVVNNVLDLSKIEAGELILDEHPFELTDLLRELETTLAEQASSKGLELTVRCAECPRILRGDVTRLRQILLNLLSNAIKFTAQGSVELTVHCETTGPGRVQLHCAVRDTGIGIAPDALARIFAPFTQADASTTRRFGGTGLGLSIVKQLAQFMGGEVDLESSLGVGTVFRLRVPLYVAEPTSLSGLTGSLDAIIAAEDPRERNELAAMLRALGWRAEAVSSVDALLQSMAERRAASQPVAAVLVDRKLPPPRPGQVLAALVEQSSGDRMPAMILVADLESPSLSTLDHIGPVDSILTRPVTLSSMFDALNAALVRSGHGLESRARASRLAQQHILLLPGVRLLVVDDSEINREVARGTLELDGAFVRTCANGAEAIELLRREAASFDAVLMDVQMPVIDGLEATRQLRRDLALSKMPVIALTAGALSGERQRAIEAGMNAFVSKPLDPRLLVETVRNEIARMRERAVPVRSREDTQVANNQSWPTIPGIDRDAVAGPLQEDVAQFITLLRLLFRESADLMHDDPVDFRDPAVCARYASLVHKLRGSTGVLGATAVYRLACSAEKVLRGPAANAEQASQNVRELRQALATLQIDAQPALASAIVRPVNGLATPVLSQETVRLFLELLRERDLRAQTQFQELQGSLASMLGSEQFARLREAIETYRFADAEKLLEDCGVAA